MTDSPCALFAEDLIAAYPQAKVILTVRDSPQAWLGSMERTILPMVRQLRKKSLFDRFDSLLTPRSPLQEYGDKVVKYTRLLDVPWDFERMYSDHNAWIQRLVPQNNRLLVYNVKAGWGPLCEFLERQVPSDEFPRVNDSSVYAKNFALSQDEARKQIMKRTVKTLIAVLVVAIAVWASYFDGLRPLQYVISVD